MNKASEVIKNAMVEMNTLERISLEYEDYAYARGINRSKRVFEKVLIKILSLENDEYA
jgi:hypothetical protein